MFRAVCDLSDERAKEYITDVRPEWSAADIIIKSVFVYRGMPKSDVLIKFEYRGAAFKYSARPSVAVDLFN